jgi:hypothetical protein
MTMDERLARALTPEFREWPKIPRWNKPISITEKIDGTNACVIVSEDLGGVYAQSRTRLITPGDDNFGFARWVQEHEDELAIGLGPGYHYGEWYGAGIQRGYGLDHKRFALFNADRWADERPACCDVVPVLYRGPAGAVEVGVKHVLEDLRQCGSQIPAAEGFDKPEGVVIFHYAGRQAYKVLLEGDDIPKGLAQ